MGNMMLNKRAFRVGIAGPVGSGKTALGAFGTPFRDLVEDPRRQHGQGPDQDGGGSTSRDPGIDLGNIQGNVLAGFNKDHQRLLFFRLGDTDRAEQDRRALE